MLAHYHFSYTEADSRNPHTFGIMSRNSAITETEALVQTTSGVEENVFHCEKIRSEVASKICQVMSVQDVKSAHTLLLDNLNLHVHL